MILTITPNPTLDRAVFVQGFRLGAIVRAKREVLTPSGKGIDASLVLHALGFPTLAIGLQAGFQGRQAVELLQALGVPHEFVWANGETRHALVLIDQEAGSQSTISAPTLHADAEHFKRLNRLLECHLQAAGFALFAGSLPPGWPESAYSELLNTCRKAGIPTMLDTSGAALAAVLRPGSGTMPDIIKVNSAELAEALGSDAVYEPVPSLDTTARAATELRARLGNQAVIVTLGALGVVAATNQGLWHARPPQVSVVNDAGAGDALAAGIAWGRANREAWPSALRLGTAAAAASVTLPGTAECDPVVVHEILPMVEVRELPIPNR